MSAEDWTDAAACAVYPLAWFFPPCTSGPTAKRDWAHARAVCSGCPVRTQCRDFALRIEEGQPPSIRFGMFGGLTPHERFAVDKWNAHAIRGEGIGA